MTVYRVSGMQVIDEIYQDAKSREEAIERFVRDRGFRSLKEASTMLGCLKRITATVSSSKRSKRQRLQPS